MRTAAIEWRWNDLKELDKPDELMKRVRAFLDKASEAQIDIIVFPGFTGCFYEQLRNGCVSLKELKEKADSSYFFEEIQNLSQEYETAVCPGSCWEKEGNHTYHTSYILSHGQILLKQRQIYMARWERELGLDRGVEAGLAEVKGWKTGIILSTDVFYPQVSRRLALKGADIVLCPVGFAGERNEALQISGMWQEVQQNLFFAIESGFNGTLGDISLWAESIIHAALEMTDEEDGFLSRSKNISEFLWSDLDNEKRKEAISGFNVLAQLNPEFYNRMRMFEGEV